MTAYRKLHPLIVAGLMGALVSACAVDHDTADTAQGYQGLTSYSADQRYIVKFKNDVGKAALNAPGISVARDLGAHGMQAVYMPNAMVDALRNNPNIEFVEVDYHRHPMGETTPYGITMVQADQLGAGSGIINVCIIDSGLNKNHEDLAGIGATGSSDSGSGTWYLDSCGHGSHVAGTIAATTGNGLGVASVAPNSVSVHSVKVFGNDAAAGDCNWNYSSDLIAALDECQANNAQVINMSLGGSFSSQAEDQAFAAADAAGVLSVAAAGNDANKRKSYPASYDSVVSVAAIDSAEQWADFSQENNAVELSAPGVGVLSTYLPGSHTLAVGSNGYFGNQLEFAALGTATGPLADGGLCDSVGSWSGAVVLCERGTITFADKYNNAKAGGAVAVVIYNNAPGNFSGTLGAADPNFTVPGISISQEEGQDLVANSLGQSGTVESTDQGDGYAFLDGTSMATPHVAGVAALVWAQHPTATNQDIRNALIATAKDLDVAGYDNKTGYGLVQAYDAALYLGPINPPVCGDGMCEGSEDPDTCPADCPSLCGDGFCNGSEDANNCPADCSTDPVCPVCGNGVCETGEDENNCPADCGTGGNCLGGDFNDFLNAGEAHAYTYTGQISGLLEAALSGDVGTDFDLYLQKKQGGSWKTVASSTGLTSDEFISFDAPLDYYRWVVNAYSGSGNYNLCIQPIEVPSECGDGSCDSGEDWYSCPLDCPLCGDGSCDVGEDVCSCPVDCIFCGNLICDPGEDVDSCPVDCFIPPVCGDGVCDLGEDQSNCMADCCPGDQFIDSLLSGGERSYIYPSSTSGLHEATLSGDSGTDYNLYLEKLTQGMWQSVTSSTNSNSNEFISYNVSLSDDYRWVVRAVSGSGNYNLCIASPLGAYEAP